jgi:hypothetical protein
MVKNISEEDTTSIFKVDDKDSEFLSDTAVTSCPTTSIHNAKPTIYISVAVQKTDSL